MIKPLIRDLIGQVLWASGLTRPQRFGRERLLVVTFHRCLTERQRQHYPYPNLAVTPEELDDLCSLFKSYFVVGSFTATYEAWRSRRSPRTPHLAITFDDGQRDNFDNARPILRKHGLLATFYIPVRSIDDRELLWHDRLGFALLACPRDEHDAAGLSSLVRSFMPSAEPNISLDCIVEEAKRLTPSRRSDFVEAVAERAECGVPDWSEMMTWQHLQELYDEGHEIGSHSMSHALLPQLADRELAYEVVESRQELAARVGATICSFCYPNGDNDQRTRDAVRRAGYANAVTTRWGLNERSTNEFSIMRCDMNSSRLFDRRGRLSEQRTFLRLSNLQPGLK